MLLGKLLVGLLCGLLPLPDVPMNLFLAYGLIGVEPGPIDFRGKSWATTGQPLKAKFWYIHGHS